jgi:hypothetical protein
VEHFLVHPDLFAALSTRHLLLSMGSSSTGRHQRCSLLRQAIPTNP